MASLDLQLSPLVLEQSCVWWPLIEEIVLRTEHTPLGPRTNRDALAVGAAVDDRDGGIDGTPPPHPLVPSFAARREHLRREQDDATRPISAPSRIPYQCVGLQIPPIELWPVIVSNADRWPWTPMEGLLLDIARRLTGVVDHAVAHLSMLDTLLTGLTVRCRSARLAERG